MPNELVRWTGDGGRRSQTANLSHEHSDEEWDLPPEEMGYGPRSGVNPGPFHGPRTRRAAEMADADASRARQQGDTAFALLREGDAGDLRQNAWDWGDLRTWLWFGAMFVGFLLLVALCYFLPEGRHASPPMARLY